MAVAQTIREKILQAMFIKLKSLGTVPPENVSRDRKAPLDRNECPAINITWAEEPTQKLSDDVMRRELRVEVTITVRGDVPTQIVDPMIREAHAALMIDKTLGGIATNMTNVDTTMAIDIADENAGGLTAAYAVEYLTSVNDLSA